MTKFSESELPEAAKEKLLSLDAARVEAEDAARSARARINGMGRDADPRIVEKLQQAAERHRQRHDDLHALTASVRQWLNGLAPGVALETYAAVGTKPHKGETVVQAIARLRDEITATKNHLRTVKAAPLPRADAKALAAVYVQQLAERGRPQVWFDRERLNVAFVDPRRPDSFAHFLDVAAFAAWLNPDVMVTRFEEAIDALPPETQTAMPKEEQEKRAAELAAALLELERQEEFLISTAAGDGLAIERRPTASPAAVLSVVVVAKQNAAQAAA